MRKSLVLALLVCLSGCSLSGTSPDSLGEEVSLRPNGGKVTTMGSRFDYMVDIVADQRGNLFLASLNAIRKISPDGQVSVLAEVKNHLAYPEVDVTTTISNPKRMTLDRHGNLYLSTLERVYKLSQDGKVTSFATPVEAGGDGIAVDSKGNIFVSSMHHDTIHKIAPDGSISLFAGRTHHTNVPGLVGSGYVDGPGSQALFRMPSGLVVDRQDNLYVADSNNMAIRKVDPTGMVTTLVGAGRDEPLPENPTPAEMEEILKVRIRTTDLAIDSAGHLYAVCSDNRIRKVSPSGAISLVAGDGVRCGDLDVKLISAGMKTSTVSLLAEATASPEPIACFVDGTGPAARFGGPLNVAVDGSGTLYVLDGGEMFQNRILRKIE